MKKLFFMILILYIITGLTGCINNSKNPSISEASVAKMVDKKTSAPLIKADRFTQSDPAIYFSIKVTDLPKGTKLKAVWKHIDDKTEVTSEILTEGTHYEVFTLKRSGSQFPPGKYEVSVTCEVNGKVYEVKSNFEIVEEAKPTHLLNPVTSRSVDDNSTLNPVNITNEFSQSDDIIYFIVQSKDLPKDSKIICVWYYLDTGDSLSNELITEGSRNIAFSLKKDQYKKLPAGKYLVTASVVINNQTESVTKEFQIKK